MYELNVSEFTEEAFLRDYWQKKPVVIRQAFVDFQDPVSADELAGLAMEEQIESRLISQDGNGKWQAKFGPFESFDELGDKNWSLVIQALDFWSESAAKLIEPFRFIPNWRLDDVMASFATPGGSVGPHIDLYDTFICQGTGSRHWRVGDNRERKQFAAHSALLHVESFEPIIDVELNAGDILYIPPGFPHEGISLDNSMSFSVGFRTTSTANIASGLADYLIDGELGTELIEDPDRQVVEESGAIDANDYQRIKSQLQQVIDNDALFRDFAGSYFTQSKHELDLVAADPEYLAEDLTVMIEQADLKRLGGLRAFYFCETIEQGICYIDGTKVNFEPEIAPAVKILLNNVTCTAQMLAPWFENDTFVAFILQQANSGYWYFSDDEAFTEQDFDDEDFDGQDFAE